MQKTAFITGVSGQDGSYLAELLLRKDYKVYGLLRRTARAYVPENIRSFISNDNFQPVYGDLLDGEFLSDFIADVQPDEVYNLAAQSVPADSWKQPIVTAEITGLGPLRILEACSKYGSVDTKIYQASSREIYGGVNVETVDESTPLFANNPYGVAKLYAHQMVNVYRESFHTFACAGILFNHESPRRGTHFVTRKLTMAAALIKLGLFDPCPVVNENGDPLVAPDSSVSMGNMDAFRDWGHAKDYVKAMWLMMRQDEPEDYVIATNTLHSIKELAATVFNIVDLHWGHHIKIDPKFIRPTEITEAKGDYSKASRELGWGPTYYFDEIIKEMVEEDLKRFKKLK